MPEQPLIATVRHDVVSDRGLGATLAVGVALDLLVAAQAPAVRLIEVRGALGVGVWAAGVERAGT